MNYGFEDSNIDQEDLLKVIMIQMDNVGTVYERRVTSVADTAALIGGIARTLFGAFEIFLFLAA